MTRDCQGTVYYVLSGCGPIIHLYNDGTWGVENAPLSWSLKEYLARLTPLRSEIMQAHA